MSVVRIGIGKGREAERIYELLGDSGIQIPASFREGKRLVVHEPRFGVTLVLARHADLPRLLLDRHVDLVLASKLWFLEVDDPKLACVGDLDFGHCRLSLLRPIAQLDRPVLRVCTRFHNLAKRFFSEAEIIRMEGCNEIALSLGFADAVVDIVETGSTLKEMNLKEVQILAEVRHSIWMKSENLDRWASIVRRIPSLAMQIPVTRGSMEAIGEQPYRRHRRNTSSRPMCCTAQNTHRD